MSQGFLPGGFPMTFGKVTEGRVTFHQASCTKCNITWEGRKKEVMKAASQHWMEEHLDKE